MPFDMNAPIVNPSVTVRLNGLREHIMHAIGMGGTELEARIDSALKDAIQRFDVAKEVEDQLQYAMREVIRQSMLSAVREVVGSEEVSSALKSAVRDALAKSAQPRKGFSVDGY